MDSIALPNPFIRTAKSSFDIGPVARALVGTACFTMSFLCLFAIARGLLGLTPDLPHLKHAAVVVHVATVLPAIPLGGYILLAAKGTPRHRMLGKIWLLLMLVTATSAIFIQSSGGFSFIHIFVPITFHAAWKTVATARKGNITGHKRYLVFTYLTALMIPGIAAFMIPGRLMHTLLLG